MDAFNPHCKKCPRLVDFLTNVKRDHPDYHCQPVAAVGVAEPSLLIVGLAPGLHGANATGRPFTGDASGKLLYETLFKFGYSNKPESIALCDGFKLERCRVTNAVKCLPPANKPTSEEIKACNGYLLGELNAVHAGGVIMALGSLAHDAILKALALKKRDFKFAHGHLHKLPQETWLIDSYHCGRYNTQTKRLTSVMFDRVFETIADLLPRVC